MTPSGDGEDDRPPPNSRRNSLAVVVAVVQGLGAVGGLALATRSLPTVEFGRLALAVVGAVLIRAVTALGLYGAVSVFYFNREGGLQEARNLIRWQSRWAMSAAGAALGAGLLTRGTLSLVLVTISLGLSMSTAFNQSNLFRAEDWAPGFSLAALGPTALAHVCGVITATVIDGTARMYVLAWASCSLGRVLWLLRSVPRRGRLARERLVAAIDLGRPLVATALSTAALAMLDRPLVRVLAGAEEVGQYFLTYVLAAGVVPLVGGFASSWLPDVLANDPTARREALVRSTRVYLPGFVALSAGLGVATPAVVFVVAGESYRYDLLGLTAGLIAVAAAPYVMYNAASIELIGTEQTRPVMRATIVGAVLAIAVNVALLPTIGVVGAAVATVIGYGATAVLALHSGDIRVSELLPMSTLVVIVSGLVIAAALPVDGGWVLARIAIAFPFGLFGAARVLRLVPAPSAAVGRDPV